MLGFPLVIYVLSSFGFPAPVLATLETSSPSNVASQSSQKPHSLPPNSVITTRISSPTATTHLATTSPTITLVVQNETTALSNSNTAVATSTLSSSATPSQTVNSSTLADINTIYARRMQNIVASSTGGSSVSSWLSSLRSDGTWADVDYATGCSAQRANWPAQVHWARIRTLSTAYFGGLEGASPWANDTDVLAAVSRAMDFWFNNDFTNNACIDQGGLDACPCGTPGLWNTNWYSNIIGLPSLVGPSCLLMNSSLTVTQLSSCSKILQRAFGTFGRSINGIGFLTGANTLDEAGVGIDAALLTTNVSLMTDAFSKINNEVAVQNAIRADGIRPDGSFSQHDGVIYNGNYGQVYTNDVISLSLEAAGTQFEAGSVSKTAFASLIDGDQWMIYRNVETGVLHWDFSVLGRFISFPVADNQATSSIQINVTMFNVLGDAWGSTVLTDAYVNLSKNTSDANAGSLDGVRVFYSNDYMVQRGPGYATTLRMYSSRTTNTECLNTQNPYGFHLSDGTVYTYLSGNEYEDIAAAWDWNLIPGTTVDYAATNLSCAQASFNGTESFVGGVSTGKAGIGAMKYTNPLTNALHWQKAWFFLEDDVQHVMVNSISSTSNASVFSVLDQRKHVSEIIVDGVAVGSGNYSTAHTLWHGNVGYTFPQGGIGSASLSVNAGNRTGNWSALGVSKQPPVNVDLFSAWLYHSDKSKPVSYTAFPATSYPSFTTKAAHTQIVELQNDGIVSAIFDKARQTAMFAFWSASGGTVTVPGTSTGESAISLSSDMALLIILDKRTWNLTISDPSQSVVNAQVILQLQKGQAPKGWGNGRSKVVPIVLPSGGLAGSSVEIPL